MSSFTGVVQVMKVEAGLCRCRGRVCMVLHQICLFSRLLWNCLSLLLNVPRPFGYDQNEIYVWVSLGLVQVNL